MIIGFALIGGSCCKSQEEIMNKVELKKIESAIHTSIGWAKNKDIDALYSVIANDSNYVEVDPGNRIVHGFEEFKKAEQFWMSPDFKVIRYEIKDLRINTSESGTVAWFQCILDDVQLVFVEDNG